MKKQKGRQVEERNEERRGEVEETWTGSCAPMFIPKAMGVIKHDEIKQTTNNKQTIQTDETEQSRGGRTMVVIHVALRTHYHGKISLTLFFFLFLPLFLSFFLSDK